MCRAGKNHLRHRICRSTGVAAGFLAALARLAQAHTPPAARGSVAALQGKCHVYLRKEKFALESQTGDARYFWGSTRMRMQELHSKRRSLA